MTSYSQGINQSSAGTDKVNAIINCHLATGRIGRPGMGPFSLDRPAQCDGRTRGRRPRQSARRAHELCRSGGCRSRAPLLAMRRAWRHGPGLKAVDLFEAVLDGKIKALWIVDTNPAVSMPRAGARARGARRLSVCRRQRLLADRYDALCRYRPAGSGLGREGRHGHQFGALHLAPARIPSPPGEARPDWWMFAEVARRMGWQSAFAYRGPAEIFREHAALSAFENEPPNRRIFDIGALSELSDETYERLLPCCWPLPRGTPEPWSGAKRLFGDGRGFATSDGRARFVATPYRPPVAPADDQWPLVLNTGRVRDQWHTMTRTGRRPRLMAHQSEPMLDVHPADAVRFQLEDGGLARIESRHGASILPVRLSNDLRQGDVFAPIHWTDLFTSAGPIDAIVGAATDPISGQPELKATPVRVAPVTPQWHALLLRSAEQMPHGPYYWARVPLDTGHAFTLAGWEALPERPRHRDLDFVAARRFGGGGTCDLCRSCPRHLPLCKRRRRPPGCMSVYCQQKIFTAIARRARGAPRHADRIGYARVSARRRAARHRRAECRRPNDLRLLWGRLAHSASMRLSAAD